MKILKRALLDCLILLLAAIVYAYGGFYIGHAIAATPMNELRSAIEPGMEPKGVAKLMLKYPDINGVMTSGSAMELRRSEIKVSFLGQWYCRADVHFEDNAVSMVDDVACYR